MLGINAAVAGSLLAAFYNPVWTSAIHSAKDFALACAAFLLLVFWKFPPLAGRRFKRNRGWIRLVLKCIPVNGSKRVPMR